MSARKKKTIQLKNLLMMTSLRCFGLLVLIVLIIVLLLGESARRSSEKYVSSLAASMDESLNLVDSTLKTVSRYLSVSKPLSDLYLSSGNRSLENLESVYDTVDLTVTYSDIIQDMAIVSQDGAVRSFYNNFALSYIDQMIARDAYDFTSAALSDAQYFFFPDSQSAHDPMFIYLFPLISVSTQTGTKRVGTVALVCRMSALQSILTLDLASAYRCQLVDAGGQAIAASTNGRLPDPLTAVNAQLPSGALPLTIQISVQNAPRLSVTPMLIAILGLLLGFILFTILYFSKVLRSSLVQPIDLMVRAMPDIHFSAGRAQLPQTDVEELDIIVGGVNRMVVQLEEASREAVRMQTQLLETQMRNNEAELYALQSQINPHFLFNTLQCVRSLAILHHAEDISTISSGLSAILRYSIREMQLVSVREEMNIIRQYLKIIDIRYQNRFTYDLDVPDEIMDYACPCMIIQPLVENAIIHGVSAADTNGEIRLQGRVEEGLIHFEVSDNGVGISEEKLLELQTRLQLQLFDMLETHEKYGKSFGLLNIQRRIQLQYGEEYGLTLSSSGGWTRLYLRFPAEPFSK